MGFKVINGINTTPGPKKSAPGSARLRADVRRSLADAALDGRLKALGPKARATLADVSRGANTRPTGKKGGVAAPDIVENVASLIKGFLRHLRHADPNAIKMSINSRPGGKKVW